MNIRPAVAADADAIGDIIVPVFRAGETYAIDRDISLDDAITYWTGGDRRAFVATHETRVVGTYYLRPNHGGGGAHVANCGYITSPEARGQGVAGAMCAHSLGAAKAAGFRAIQFNFVVRTNRGAIRLWQAHGFEIVGTLPRAFDHPAEGWVDALVMYRAL